MTAKQPEAGATDKGLLADFEVLKEVVSGVRAIRRRKYPQQGGAGAARDRGHNDRF